MGQIIIEGHSKWYNRLKKVNIFIDGEKVESINNGERKIYDVKQGNHNIQAKFNRISSNTIELHTNNESHIDLKVDKNIARTPQILGLVTLVCIAFVHIKEYNFLNETTKYIALILIPLLIITLFKLVIGKKKYLQLKEKK